MDANTVGAVADLTGVSVRTLHHYDHIGLVVPTVRTPAGYRGYTDADIQRLHLVLVYRSVGMPLDEIRALLDDSSADVLQHRGASNGFQGSPSRTGSRSRPKETHCSKRWRRPSATESHPVLRTPTTLLPGTGRRSIGSTTAATRCTATWRRCIWPTTASRATTTTSSRGWPSSCTASSSLASIGDHRAPPHR